LEKLRAAKKGNPLRGNLPERATVKTRNQSEQRFRMGSERPNAWGRSDRARTAKEGGKEKKQEKGKNEANNSKGRVDSREATTEGEFLKNNRAKVAKGRKNHTGAGDTMKARRGKDTQSRVREVRSTLQKSPP